MRTSVGRQTCLYCGQEMQESQTTFTAVGADAVYVVRDVPCLKCPTCDYTLFGQDVSKRLERYASGRVIPHHAPLKAWVYVWGDPVIFISEDTVASGTKNITLSRANSRVVV